MIGLALADGILVVIVLLVALRTNSSLSRRRNVVDACTAVGISTDRYARGARWRMVTNVVVIQACCVIGLMAAHSFGFEAVFGLWAGCAISLPVCYLAFGILNRSALPGFDDDYSAVRSEMKRQYRLRHDKQGR